MTRRRRRNGRKRWTRVGCICVHYRHFDSSLRNGGRLAQEDCRTRCIEVLERCAARLAEFEKLKNKRRISHSRAIALGRDSFTASFADKCRTTLPGEIRHSRVVQIPFVDAHLAQNLSILLSNSALQHDDPVKQQTYSSIDLCANSSVSHLQH